MQHLSDIDKDRYLLSFFADAPVRPALHVLDRFNYEIARLREATAQPHVGMIRLQWWRERVAEIYEGKISTEHDVIPDLARVVSAFGIGRSDVMALIDAREQDFLLEAPLTEEQFLEYARATHAPLLHMKSKIAGAKEKAAAIDTFAASYAVIGLVRAAPFHKEQGRALLPELFPTSVAPHNAAMIESVKAVCRKMDEDVEGLTITSRYLKAHAVFVRLYLKHIAACGYDPFHLTPLPFLELRLWWAAEF
ncbi:MAG: squalene/phytoene synthase family protein [Pseudobdellovibrionaceae bacterium]